MKKIALCLFLLLAIKNYGQDLHRVIDSLKKIVAFHKGDTTEANSLLALSSIEIQQGNFNEGLNYSSKAIEISSKLGFNKTLAGGYNNKGAAYFSMGDFDNAISSYEKGLKIKELIGDKNGVGKTLGNIGAVYTQQGNYPLALNYHYKALSVFESINDKKGIVAPLSNIGLIYIYQNLNDKAFEVYQKLIKHYKDNNINRSANYAIALSNTGMIYAHKKMYDKAMELYKEALAINDSLSNRKGISLVLSNIANVHNEKGEYDIALEFIKRALELCIEINDKAGQSNELVNLGVNYFKTKDYTSSEKHLLEALQIENEVGNFKSINMAYDFLSRIHVIKGNYKSAYDYYVKAIAYRDSMFNEENTKKSVAAEMNFEFEKKQAILKAENEKAMALEQVEQRRKNLIILFVSIGLGLVIVLALVILKSLIQNQAKNKIITEQKLLVEEKNKEVLDSINYAKRIQTGILPDENRIKSVFENSFVLYKPKDIVSGDFYWFFHIHKPKENKNIAAVVAADCTGHGVPGAFMSMLNSTLLNQTIYNPAINSPADALNFLNQELPKNLKSFDKNSTIKDGMDLSFCLIDLSSNVLTYAGANNPCIIIRQNELIELKPTKQSITAAEDSDKKIFTNQTFALQKNDNLYLFTDGFADQFGGPKGKKFKYKQLYDILLNISSSSAENQKNQLNEIFTNWKGKLEQVDDVLIIGIKI